MLLYKAHCIQNKFLLSISIQITVNSFESIGISSSDDIRIVVNVFVNRTAGCKLNHLGNFGRSRPPRTASGASK